MSLVLKFLWPNPFQSRTTRDLCFSSERVLEETPTQMSSHCAERKRTHPGSACEQCRHSKLKCDSLLDGSACERCKRRELDCSLKKKHFTLAKAKKRVDTCTLSAFDSQKRFEKESKRTRSAADRAQSPFISNTGTTFLHRSEKINLDCPNSSKTLAQPCLRLQNSINNHETATGMGDTSYVPIQNSTDGLTLEVSALSLMSGIPFAFDNGLTSSMYMHYASQENASQLQVCDNDGMCSSTNGTYGKFLPQQPAFAFDAEDSFRGLHLLEDQIVSKTSAANSFITSSSKNGFSSQNYSSVQVYPTLLPESSDNTETNRSNSLVTLPENIAATSDRGNMLSIRNTFMNQTFQAADTSGQHQKKDLALNLPSQIFSNACAGHNLPNKTDTMYHNIDGMFLPHFRGNSSSQALPPKYTSAAVQPQNSIPASTNIIYPQHSGTASYPFSATSSLQNSLLHVNPYKSEPGFRNFCGYHNPVEEISNFGSRFDAKSSKIVGFSADNTTKNVDTTASILINSKGLHNKTQHKSTGLYVPVTPKTEGKSHHSIDRKKRHVAVLSHKSDGMYISQNFFGLPRLPERPLLVNSPVSLVFDSRHQEFRDLKNGISDKKSSFATNTMNGGGPGKKLYRELHLFEPSRPQYPERELLLHLIILFDRFYQASCFPWIDVAELLDLAHANQLPAVVANAVCALTIRFSQRVHTTHVHIASETFAQMAKNLVMPMLCCPSVEVVEALLILSYAEHGAGAEAGFRMYVGMASRMAIDLGLHREISIRNFPTQEQQKRARYVFWALVSLDRIIIFGTDRISIFPDDTFDSELPTLEGDSPNRILIFGFVVRALIERGRIAELLRDSANGREESWNIQKYARIQSLWFIFSSLHRSLPSRLQLGSDRRHVMIGDSETSAIIYLHMLLQSTLLLYNQPYLLCPTMTSYLYDKGAPLVLDDSVKFASTTFPTLLLLALKSEQGDFKAGRAGPKVYPCIDCNPHLSQLVLLVGKAFLMDERLTRNLSRESQEERKGKFSEFSCPDEQTEEEWQKSHTDNAENGSLGHDQIVKSFFLVFQRIISCAGGRCMGANLEIASLLQEYRKSFL